MAVLIHDDGVHTSSIDLRPVKVRNHHIVSWLDVRSCHVLSSPPRRSCGTIWCGPRSCQYTWTASCTLNSWQLFASSGPTLTSWPFLCNSSFPNALWNKGSGSYVIKDYGTLPLIFSTFIYFRWIFQPWPSFFPALFQLNEKGASWAESRWRRRKK